MYDWENSIETHRHINCIDEDIFLYVYICVYIYIFGVYLAKHIL